MQVGKPTPFLYDPNENINVLSDLDASSSDLVEATNKIFESFKQEMDKRQRLIAQVAQLEEELKALDIKPASGSLKPISIPKLPVISSSPLNGAKQLTSPLYSSTSQFYPSNGYIVPRSASLFSSSIIPSYGSTQILSKTEKALVQPKPSSKLETKWHEECLHETQLNEEKLLAAFKKLIECYLDIDGNEQDIFTLLRLKDLESAEKEILHLKGLLLQNLQKLQPYFQTVPLPPFHVSEVMALLPFIDKFFELFHIPKSIPLQLAGKLIDQELENCAGLASFKAYRIVQNSKKESVLVPDNVIGAFTAIYWQKKDATLKNYYDTSIKEKLEKILLEAYGSRARFTFKIGIFQNNQKAYYHLHHYSLLAINLVLYRVSDVSLSLHILSKFPGELLAHPVIHLFPNGKKNIIIPFYSLIDHNKILTHLKSTFSSLPEKYLKDYVGPLAIPYLILQYQQKKKQNTKTAIDNLIKSLKALMELGVSLDRREISAIKAELLADFSKSHPRAKDQDPLKLKSLQEASLAQQQYHPLYQTALNNIEAIKKARLPNEGIYQNTLLSGLVLDAAALQKLEGREKQLNQLMQQLIEETRLLLACLEIPKLLEASAKAQTTAKSLLEIIPYEALDLEHQGWVDLALLDFTKEFERTFRLGEHIRFSLTRIPAANEIKSVLTNSETLDDEIEINTTLSTGGEASRKSKRKASHPKNGQKRRTVETKESPCALEPRKDNFEIIFDCPQFLPIVTFAKFLYSLPDAKAKQITNFNVLFSICLQYIPLEHLPFELPPNPTVDDVRKALYKIPFEMLCSMEQLVTRGVSSLAILSQQISDGKDIGLEIDRAFSNGLLLEALADPDKAKKLMEQNNTNTESEAFIAHFMSLIENFDAYPLDNPSFGISRKKLSEVCQNMIDIKGIESEYVKRLFLENYYYHQLLESLKEPFVDLVGDDSEINAPVCKEEALTPQDDLQSQLDLIAASFGKPAETAPGSIKKEPAANPNHPDPRKTPLLVEGPIIGMPNTGNSCYINASLQALIGSQVFQNLLLQSPPAKELKFKEIKDLIINYIKAVNEQRSADAWDASLALRKKMSESKAHPEFYERQGQKDAEAFVSILLESCSYSYKEQYTRSGVKDKITYTSAAKPEDIWILPIEFPKDLKNFKLTTLIEDSFNEAKEDKNNAWIYEDNQKKITFVKYNVQRKLIEKIPPLLVIQLKRYLYERSQSSKVNGDVEMPQNDLLDMTSYMDEKLLKKGDKAKYRLVGCVNHKGEHLRTGHYIAYTLRQNSWYCVSDNDYIKQVNLEEIQKEKAYMLIFERVDENAVT